jgi:hypothetical protein
VNSIRHLILAFQECLLVDALLDAHWSGITIV